MIDVLLGQSYFLHFDPKMWEAMQPYPPLGTLYAASYVRQRGYSVALFDAMLAASEEEWDAALARTQPTVAILYEDNFNYLSKMCLSRMRQAAVRMVRLARARGCAVVVAGSDATDHPEVYLHEGAYAVVRGEGEATLAELLDHLSGHSRQPLASIRGLAYLSEGSLCQTPPRPDFRDLDALPFPAWDLVDLPRYRAIWQWRHGYFSVNVATSRGCPFHCNWCAKPIWGQRYAVRSPENVVREMAWLRRAHDPDHIWFVDDIFGLQPGWIERFAGLVERESLRIPFKSLQRADLLLAGDTVGALQRAGARTVWVGAESGSQRVLDAMEKGTRVEHIYEANRRLQAAGIEVGFFLQFGYPGETRQDIDRTLQLVRDCRPDDIGVSVSYPLPGTKFYRNVERELGVKQHWSDSSDLAMLYRGPYSTAFYRLLHTVVHREFRSQKFLGELSRVPWRPRGLRPRHTRDAIRWIVDRMALPVDRWRLERLSRTSGQSRELPAATAPSSIAGKPVAQATVSIERRLLDTRHAFDVVASDYDGPTGNNALVQRARAHLQATARAVFGPGSRLLDLGCGTGLDAVFLAQQGYDVTAIDWSPRMVERTQAHARAAGVAGRVRAQVLGIHELARLRGERFDGAYADLGSLNCVPDLAAAAQACAEVLIPHGRLVASVIGRVCPWEIAYYTLRRDLRRARLRNQQGAVPVGLRGETVWTHYYTPREFSRALAPYFIADTYRALGWTLPPPYLIGLQERLGVLGDALGWLDELLGTWPVLRDAGDHFLMVLTRHEGADAP